MLLHDDVVSDGQAKASALSSRFCCEKWIEHLFPNLGRNTCAVIANSDLNFVTEVLCRRPKGRLMSIGIALLFARLVRLTGSGSALGCLVVVI